MAIIILLVVAVIVYLLLDNRKVAAQMAATPEPVQRAQMGCGIGYGWLLIIMMTAWLIIGAAVGFENINIGYMPDGSFTLTQPHDPNNPFARPVGEMLGYERDAQGHWSK